jgi:hypothetical protein
MIDIEKLKKLQERFDPYNDKFSNGDWHRELEAILGFDLECNDYFYDGEILDAFIQGYEKAKEEIK